MPEKRKPLGAVSYNPGLRRAVLYFLVLVRTAQDGELFGLSLVTYHISINTDVVPKVAVN